MRSLFDVLDSILSSTTLSQTQKVALLNDEDAIVKYAEREVDVEIDSDAALQLQQLGLQYAAKLQNDSSQWAQLRAQAKAQLD